MAPAVRLTGLDFKGQKAQQVYDQYLSFMNMSLGNVAAALDANEFFKSPIFYFVCNLKPGTAATTLTVQGEFEGAPAASTLQQLCVCTVHNRVMEWKYGSDADEYPSTVTVQNVL